MEKHYKRRIISNAERKSRNDAYTNQNEEEKDKGMTKRKNS
jgi:hypothetical protein